jgi:hypothetical protein
VAADELTIAKQALIHLGETRLPTSTDGTIAAIVQTDWPSVIALQALYTQARQTTLRGFPWPWALKTVTLVLASDGDGEIWTDEWANAYTYPADCLQVLRFLTERGPADPCPPRFLIGTHASVKVIFTDVEEEDADILYIEDVSTTTRFTAHFDNALSWRLSHELAMVLAADPRLRDWTLQNAAIALSVAQRVEANEGTPPPEFLTDGTFSSTRFI